MPPTTASRSVARRLAVLAWIAAAVCALLLPAPGFAAPVAVARDITFRAATAQSGPLRLDVWRRPGTTGRPVVVMFHGGGWQAGSRTEWEQRGWARSFAAAGYVVVTPSYRLACIDLERADRLCGATMAAQRSDVVAATHWTLANARRWGGDPDRVVLLGGSAGAHLALLAAADPTLASRLRGVAGISPPLDLRSIGRLGLWLQSAAAQAIRCSWAQCPARWTSHSPRVALERTRRVPPLYLFSSRRDVRVSRVDVVRTTASLRSLGVSVASREPVATSSGCHGPWACERLTVAGTRRTLRADLAHWMAAVTAPRPLVARTGDRP